MNDIEAIGIEVLQFIASDPDRLHRFLNASGLTAETLRQAAQAPGFFANVVAFLSQDEADFLTFAANHGYDPAKLAAMITRLNPPADYS